MALIIFLYFNSFNIVGFGEKKIFNGNSYLFNPSVILTSDVSYGLNIGEGMILNYAYFAYGFDKYSFTSSISRYEDSYEGGFSAGMKIFSYFNSGGALYLEYGEEAVWKQKIGVLFDMDTLKGGITFSNRFRGTNINQSHQEFNTGLRYRKGRIDLSLFNYIDTEKGWDFELYSGYLFIPLYVFASISRNVLGIGMNYAIEDVNLELTLSYNFSHKEPHISFEYKRSVNLPIKKVIVKYVYVEKEDSNIGKEKEEITESPQEEIKEVRVSPEVLKKQEELLKKGSKYYAREKYQEAVKTWEEVIKINPDTGYARKARDYINKVKKILNK